MFYNFRVEYTKAENNYTFSGQWADIICVAENELEAIELVKQHFIENDVDPEGYIFRATKYED